MCTNRDQLYMRQRSDSNRQSQMVLVGGGGQEHCEIKGFNFFLYLKRILLFMEIRIFLEETQIRPCVIQLFQGQWIDSLWLLTRFVFNSFYSELTIHAKRFFQSAKSQLTRSVVSSTIIMKEVKWRLHLHLHPIWSQYP